MKRSMFWLLPAATLVLALGCGGKDETTAAPDSAESEISAPAAPAEPAAAPAPAEPESPAAQAEADPVANCKALAARAAWAEALEACTQAHELHPDDLALEHALQQAQAAVE